MPLYARPEAVETVRLRCVCDDCWSWAGYVTKDNIPAITRIKDGRKTSLSGRRWVYEAATGEVLTKSQIVIVKCGNPRCLNPDHLRKILNSTYRKTLPISASTRVARLRGAKKAGAKHAKLSMEKAAYIRASEKNNTDLAKEFNVTSALISAVRLNKLWVNYSNPFSGLGAL